MCTGVRLMAQNGAVIYGRTLEFGQEINSDIIIIPAAYTFVGTVAAGKSGGLSWKSRYAVVGANALDIVGVVDGVNQMGLAGGLFYFPGYAEFQCVTEHNVATTIAPWEILTWILTTCGTVAEVRERLPTITVGATIFSPWGFVPPLHAIVHDTTGASLVIEYVGGKLIMYDNPLGVFTNAPTFDWHMTNLRNYVRLTPTNTAQSQWTDYKLAAFGQGSGMLGLPGDFTPPARFVRAAVFSQTIVQSRDEYEALKTLFHLLDLFNIPRGIVRQGDNGDVAYDYTQWTSAVDLAHKRYYWHSYESRTVQMVDLMACDVNSKEPVIRALEPEQLSALKGVYSY